MVETDARSSCCVTDVGLLRENVSLNTRTQIYILAHESQNLADMQLRARGRVTDY